MELPVAEFVLSSAGRLLPRRGTIAPEGAMNRETAERCTILRGLVGSTVHGLNVDDGIEDRDEMGICVEPLEEAMALTDPFEQFIYRSAAEREGRALFTPEDQLVSCDALGAELRALTPATSASDLDLRSASAICGLITPHVGPARRPEGRDRPSGRGWHRLHADRVPRRRCVR
jgi:hypothetical protein